MGILHVCLYTTCRPETLSYQKKVSGLQELVLQMVVHFHEGAGNWIIVFWKNSYCSYRLSHLPRPCCLLNFRLLGLPLVVCAFNPSTGAQIGL